ncbi:hypothetical protein NE234_00550 [Actinoallomurus sp. WRP9H-5]|nr:hypothetical protein [Actinoallomurus rhizosphaericola]
MHTEEHGAAVPVPVVTPHVRMLRIPLPTRGLAMVGDMGRVAAAYLPPRDRLMFYGGLAAAAAIGVLDWPVAAAVGVGTMVARRAVGRRETARPVPASTQAATPATTPARTTGRTTGAGRTTTGTSRSRTTTGTTGRTRTTAGTTGAKTTGTSRSRTTAGTSRARATGATGTTAGEGAAGAETGATGAAGTATTPRSTGRSTAENA